MISSSATPFFSCPQSFPESGSFPISWLFTSGSQRYWSFSFSISSSNEYSGLISFKIAWFDLLAVQGTLLLLLSRFSCVRVFVTPWTPAPQASLSITISRSLLKLMSIESVTPLKHLLLCRALLLLPSVFPSIRVFSNKSALCIRWPK